MSTLAKAIGCIVGGFVTLAYMANAWPEFAMAFWSAFWRIALIATAVNVAVLLVLEILIRHAERSLEDDADEPKEIA